MNNQQLSMKKIDFFILSYSHNKIIHNNLVILILVISDQNDVGKPMVQQ